MWVEEECKTLDQYFDPICIVRSDGSCNYFNEAWRRYAAEQSPKFASDDWLECVHPSDRHRVACNLKEAVRSEELLEADVRLEHSVDGFRWFLFRARPRLDEGGAVMEWLCVLTDIHQIKLRKLGLVQKSRAQADMLNASVDCIKMIERDGTLSQMNKAGCVALNVSEETGFGMEWLGLLPEEVHSIGKLALAEALAGKSARFPGVSKLPNERPRYWDNMLTPLMNEDREVESILCVSRDVTAQRESEQQIELLVHELNHRSKNMLTVIQELIRQSVPNPDAEFVKVLERRIASIARNQDLLIRGRLTGSKVRDVIVFQTAAVGKLRSTRMQLIGDPELRISPNAAEVLCLAIYELTTNALKYGAFSNESGTVAVEWSVEDASDGARFHLQWTEAGGPKVIAPSRKGFGTVVIESNPAAALRAEVALNFHSEGLVWKLSAPTGSVLAE
ncbi:PAS domain-containing protein [Hyphomicrobium sp. LHD-15]|uniref:PAS domain-containing protein n=1 Tax=Hyphomicrobium sp. LHD-15 TaxID=3072142 RepID=UPI00280E582B|nr:PAS domain-containing protein [Hyphomicrobium sp. LHD-15]MDQ8700556.1 PAS domain-containing protein [Hyphomicrobium sp. LHD-15]